MQPSLTSQQKTTIKNHIQSSPDTASIPMTPDGYFEIAALLNAPASPTYRVWRSSANTNSAMESAGFDWTRVDNLSVGKARIWDWMMMQGQVNPSNSNIIAGVNACFSAVGDEPTRLAIFTSFHRPATRVEKLLATGSGVAANSSGVGPSTMGSEGPISAGEVQDLMNSP